MQSLLAIKMKYSPSLTLCLCFAFLSLDLSLSTKLVIKGRLTSHFWLLFFGSLFIPLSGSFLLSFILLAASCSGKAGDPSGRPSRRCPCATWTSSADWARSSSGNGGRVDANYVRYEAHVAPWKSPDSTHSSCSCDVLHCAAEREEIYQYRDSHSSSMYLYSPLANVEDAWPLHDHGMQLPLQTLLRHMLQRPVPVIIIVGAEVPCTLAYALPCGTVEGEAHIVLATDPRHRLHLEKKGNEEV